MAKLTQFQFTKDDEKHEIDCVKFDADDSISLMVRDALTEAKEAINEKLESVREALETAQRFEVVKGGISLGIDKALAGITSVSMQKEAYKLANGFKEAKQGRVSKNKVAL